MSPKRLIIALDIGTTTSKTAIYDLETKKNFISLNEYGLITPKPGWVEIDPEKIWSSVVTGIRECFDKSGFDPKDVGVICYSVIGCAVVPLDRKGNALYNFIEGWDARSNGYSSYFSMIDKKIGIRRLFDITGNYLIYGSLNKILWLRENEKEIFENTWKFVCVGDYITYRFTGRPVIDYSMASNMMVFDSRALDYSDTVLEGLELERTIFPETVRAGNVVGEISKDISEELGMSKNVKIVAGAHDQICAAIGVGNIKESTVSDGLGTVECIGLTMDKMITDDDMFKNMYPSYPHALDRRYFSFGVQLSSGLMLKWYKDILCNDEVRIAEERDKDAYEVIIENAKVSPVGANGILILPHLRGGSTGIDPPLNIFSKCAIIGLDMAHNKTDISRALLESVAFESRVLLEGLEKKGVVTEELRATGGGTKSDFWLQIRADIINKKIMVPEFKDAGLLGAVILASKGMGYYDTYVQAVEELVKIEKTIYPQEDKKEKYDSYYEIYKGLYPSLLDTYEFLSRVRDRII